MSKKASPDAPHALPPLRRLLPKPPRIHIGPDAEPALRGERGLLLGAHRPRWVDVLRFEPRGLATWGDLVDLRFGSFEPWEVVGLGLPLREARTLWRLLLRELVPGDVVVTEKGPAVHLGDTWTEAPLVWSRKASARAGTAATSARSGPRRR